MFRNNLLRLQFKRTYLSPNPSINAGTVHVEARAKRKIKVGKARPAIYHKFNTKVQLSDGSVIVRRTMYPKAEMTMINDQRNNPLWNPSKKNIAQVNEQAATRLSKFKQKFTLYGELDAKSEESSETTKTDAAAPAAAAPAAKETKTAVPDDDFGLDDYLSLMSENVQEVQSGGKLQQKQKAKKSKK